MIATRCQRFYTAADPTHWLRMPLQHLAFFTADIAGLQAEESLRRVKELRIAFAPADEDGDSHHLAEREWTEQARRAERDEQSHVKPKLTKAEYDATLRFIGVYRKEWLSEGSE